MIRWDDRNPVFWDVETQSAADLKEVGGRLYASDPSTRVLSAVFLVDGVFHVWLPSHVCTAEAAAKLDPGRMWPAQLGPAQPLRIHHGDQPPAAAVRAARDGRTFVAHNCFGFDRFIWRHCIGETEPPWADTVPMARLAGLPGRLDAIARDLIGQGKDAGSRILKKHWSAVPDPAGGYRYSSPGPGDLEVILRYNVADVDLLRRAWEALADVPVEADVIAANDAINGRGVRVDTALAQKLVAVSHESVGRAAVRIAELTGGELHAGNLRSTKQVNAWLDSHGVKVADYNGKRTLRKDFVSQALANPWLMLDDDAPVAAVENIDPAVFEVLRLRSAALRITGAKGERAVLRAGADGRARDLHTYHQAHTGRFSSAGIQIHNLPRPRKGVPVADLLAQHESGVWGHDAAAAYDAIAAQLPPKLSVDDAVSSLLRPLFVPNDGNCFVISDYAAVECCGIVSIADEADLLSAFAQGRDIYKELAVKLFRVPFDEVNDLQRQVCKIITLACQYGLGPPKFGIVAGLMGVDLAAAGVTSDQCVEAFRSAYPAIAGTYAGSIDGKPYRTGGVWWKLAKAATAAVTEGGVKEAGRTRWTYSGSTLICTLPSGRQLRYRNARIEDRVPGYAKALGLDRPKATLVYDGTFGESTLYGGKITENVVQAICRDLLATALVQCDAAGLPVVLHVHDEIVAEVPRSRRDESLNALATVMTTPPPWAAGFPIAVEAFTAPRYLKGPPAGWPHLKKSAVL